MKKLLLLFLILNSELFIYNSFAQTLTRGPYLQSPGQTSMIIRWRTDVASDSRVYYGSTLGSTANVVDSTNVTTEHRVKISGLSPATTYYYNIGSTTAMLGETDSLMYFTTAPDTTTSTPIRLWAIGDFGHGNEAQADVRDSYERFAENEGAANLWIWLGDNVYQDGTEEEYDAKVFDSVYGYKHLMKHLPFASTSGNHDYNSICPWEQPGFCSTHPDNHTGPYLNFIDPPTEGELGGVPSHRKLFYSFDYGDAHITVLNSELGSLNSSYNWIGMLNNDTSFTSPMLEWLKADLASTTKKWKIVIWHQTPYSGQDGFTDSFAQPFCVATRVHFNPIIERYGVDLVLLGHDHNYQRTYLINGHYGNSNTFQPSMMLNGTSGNPDLGEYYYKYIDGPIKDKGTVYVVEGNSSASNDQSPFEHPAIYWGEACADCFGSFVVDINGDRLDGRYLHYSDTIRDKFTIIKTDWAHADVQEQNVSEIFKIYPNPNNGQFTVEYTLTQKSKVSIEVLDISGRVIYSQMAANGTIGKHSEKLNITKDHISAGTYFVKLGIDDVNRFGKIKVE
jgi:hypothetical protein